MCLPEAFTKQLIQHDGRRQNKYNHTNYSVPFGGILNFPDRGQIWNPLKDKVFIFKPPKGP